MIPPSRVHPQPSELIAKAWLQSLSELRNADVVVGWDALGSWDGQQTMVTIDDVFSDLPGPFAVENCVQIDVWSPDRAEELAQAIWRRVETANAKRLSAPKFIPDQGGRCSLDLEFHVPAEKRGQQSVTPGDHESTK